MDIKPCPFCNSKIIYFRKVDSEDREGTPCELYCQDCGACGPWLYQKQTEEPDLELIKAWNKRYSYEMKLTWEHIDINELARDVKTMIMLEASENEIEEFIKNWKPATEDSTDEIKTNCKPVPTICPKCNSTNVSVRVAESSDGAYEDYNYRCHKCNHNWWVDGSDY